MRFAIAFPAKRFAHRSNLGTVSPRAFSGGSYDYNEKIRDGFGEMVKSRPLPTIVEFSELVSATYGYREKLRNGFLQDVKLDDAIYMFSEMVESRPLPSIVDLLITIAKMKQFDVVISLGEKMQMMKQFSRYASLIQFILEERVAEQPR